MAQNRAIPERILNSPKILPGLELYYIAFIDLVATRPIGMSIGPIWWTSIQDYCDRLGLDSEQQEAMHFHIKALDLAYMEHMNKKDGKSSPIQQKHQETGLANRKRGN